MLKKLTTRFKDECFIHSSSEIVHKQYFEQRLLYFVNVSGMFQSKPCFSNDKYVVGEKFKKEKH